MFAYWQVHPSPLTDKCHSTRRTPKFEFSMSRGCRSEGPNHFIHTNII